MLFILLTYGLEINITYEYKEWEHPMVFPFYFAFYLYNIVSIDKME